MNIIRKGVYRDHYDRLLMLVAHLAGFLDLLVFVLSLSYLASEFRTKVLFSNWFSRVVYDE